MDVRYNCMNKEERADAPKCLISAFVRCVCHFQPSQALDSKNVSKRLRWHMIIFSRAGMSVGLSGVAVDLAFDGEVQTKC